MSQLSRSRKLATRRPYKRRTLVQTQCPSRTLLNFCSAFAIFVIHNNHRFQLCLFLCSSKSCHLFRVPSPLDQFSTHELLPRMNVLSYIWSFTSLWLLLQNRWGLSQSEKLATHPSFCRSDIHPKCMMIRDKFPHAYCRDFGTGFRRVFLIVGMFLWWCIVFRQHHCNVPICNITPWE